MKLNEIINSFMSIQNGSIPIWEWDRVRIFTYGQIIMIALIGIIPIFLPKISKHAFTKKPNIIMLNFSIASYFIFFWYYLFLFLIGNRPVPYDMYDYDILGPFLITIFFTATVIVIGSTIWFIVSHLGDIKIRDMNTISESSYSLKKWIVIPILVMGFIYIPIFVILSISSSLMINEISGKEKKNKGRIIGYSTIVISLSAVALLLLGICYRIRFWWLNGWLLRSYIPIAIGIALILLTLRLNIIFKKHLEKKLTTSD